MRQPETLLYSKTHEWVDVETVGGRADQLRVWAEEAREVAGASA